MGLAFPLLVELALGVAYREASNGDRVASPGIPPLLEMDEQAQSARETRCVSGSSRPHS